jgi:hypothetical protein
MKEVDNLLILSDLIGEEVLHSVDIVGVPLEFQALRLCCRRRPERFMLPKH